MAVLWCGSEDIDFPNWNVPKVVTGAGHYRSNVRCGIRPVTVIGAGIKSCLFPGGAITSGWLSFYVYVGGTTTGMPKSVGLVLSSTGMKGVYVGTKLGTPSSKLSVCKYDGTNTTELASETGSSMVSASLQRIDMYLGGVGAGAVLKVYLDGVLVIDTTVDASVTGVTGYDCVVIYSEASAIYWEISEVLVANEDCRAWGVCSHYPSGVGDANTLDAGVAGDIDDATIDDTDILSSATTGQAAQFALSNLPAGTYVIKGVKEIFRGVKGASGIAKWKHGIKSGGTINVGQTDTMALGWASYERLMTVNPVTSNPFTAAEINALQVAYESLT